MHSNLPELPLKLRRSGDETLAIHESSRAASPELVNLARMSTSYGGTSCSDPLSLVWMCTSGWWRETETVSSRYPARAMPRAGTVARDSPTRYVTRGQHTRPTSSSPIVIQISSSSGPGLWNRHSSRSPARPITVIEPPWIPAR